MKRLGVNLNCKLPMQVDEDPEIESSIEFQIYNYD